MKNQVFLFVFEMCRWDHYKNDILPSSPSLISLSFLLDGLEESVVKMGERWREMMRWSFYLSSHFIFNQFTILPSHLLFCSRYEWDLFSSTNHPIPNLISKSISKWSTIISKWRSEWDREGGRGREWRCGFERWSILFVFYLSHHLPSHSYSSHLIYHLSLFTISSHLSSHLW